MARRDFDLRGAPRSAKLDITAHDRYLLYVNGEYLGRGPARSDPRWKSYDIYDVGSHLRVGKNVIAVLAYHYGCHNGYTRDAWPDFFAQLIDLGHFETTKSFNELLVSSYVATR